MKLQLAELFPALDKLQLIHGDPTLDAIYGAGCTDNPYLMFILMNPTGKNISASRNWNGIKAPWLGTKNIWKMLYKLGLLDQKFFGQTQNLKSTEWNDRFAQDLYSYLFSQKLYLTSLAKCTQIDARPLHNRVFKEYIPSVFEEIKILNPNAVITFGNQVSSIILSRPIRVSDYTELQSEKLTVGNKSFNVYPTFYPVGQGMRNMPLAIERIKQIKSHLKI
jgi:uracil-DNA glycosylase